MERYDDQTIKNKPNDNKNLDKVKKDTYFYINDIQIYCDMKCTWNILSNNLQYEKLNTKYLLIENFN